MRIHWAKVVIRRPANWWPSGIFKAIILARIARINRVCYPGAITGADWPPCGVALDEIAAAQFS